MESQTFKSQPKAGKAESREANPKNAQTHMAVMCKPHFCSTRPSAGSFLRGSLGAHPDARAPTPQLQHREGALLVGLEFGEI